MMTMQKAGGVAALIQALTYIVGFGVLATLLNPGATAGWSALQKLDFILERSILFQTWMIFIYVVFGIALVVVAVALHERLSHHSAGLMKVASPFALIWAGLVIASGMVAIVGLESAASLRALDANQAASLWRTLGVVQEGLGGGVEVVGGLWMLLISYAALHVNAFPKVLNSIGMIVGVAGLLTIAPPLAMAGAVFGLGQILWFIWVGTLLIRGSEDRRRGSPSFP